MNEIQIMTDSASDISYEDEKPRNLFSGSKCRSDGSNHGADTACLEELHSLMVQKLGFEPASTYRIGAAVAVNSGSKVSGIAFTRKKDR